MQAKQVGGLAIVVMLATGATVYAVTPEGGFSPEQPAATDGAPPPADGPAGDAAREEKKTKTPSLFVDEKAVRVEARLGHRDTPAQGSAETYVMLELRGSDNAAPTTNAGVHLGLVIDKSGSMRGKRFENAKSSAQAAIDRLVDGDTVSVVAFDTQTETVVAPTKVDASTRESLKQRVAGIALGGDTCISCGIDTMAGLMAQTPDVTRRMIVLSDGDATAGVRDVDEMRNVARRARAAGVTVSGIGMDLQYNERMMAAVAEGGEGQHRFVAQPSDLTPVFEAEAASLRQTVAENVEARVRLEPGVELIEVLDRPFTRSGDDLLVSLGSLTKGEVKTVLCRVRVPAGSSREEVPVAGVSVRFRDLTAPGGKTGESTGTLAAFSSSAQGDPDPFVLARVERSETARALDEANRLFRAGQLDAARQRLDARRESLKQKKGGAAFRPAPKPNPFSRAGEASRDVDKQLGILDRASSGFASPPPPEPAPVAPAQPGAKPKPAPKSPARAPADPFESNAKQNQEDAFQQLR